MKNLSIKLKVTLFNTLLMFLVVLLVLLFMLTISSSLLEATCISQLEDVIHDNIDELEYEDGIVELEDVDFYKNNVTTLLYGVDGTLLYGSAKKMPTLTQPTTDGALINLTTNGTTYYVYDRYILFPNNTALWMRGVVSANEMNYIVTMMLQLAFIALPLFIIGAGVGCYFIATQAFRPIEHMVTTARTISNSNDLSSRIPLPKVTDEIHLLGDTFNQMLGRLEEAFQMERQFSSDVSHELRTPNAVILAQCEYALEKTSTVEDQLEALEVVQRQALKVQVLISNLLNLTRLDRGMEHATFSKCNLTELITIVCEEQEGLAPKGMTLHYELSTPDIYMEADYSMVIRMVTNLISNGFSYGKENGCITITLLEELDTIQFIISDNGIGIPTEHQPKIFNRFYQVDSSRSNQEGGSMGLGLSMVAQIVKIHQGTIALSSELDVGTTFTIIFPKV
ncbi:MAG: ATP-binding protein [Eubacteriales bacterium]